MLRLNDNRMGMGRTEREKGELAITAVLGVVRMGCDRIAAGLLDVGAATIEGEPEMARSELEVVKEDLADLEDLIGELLGDDYRRYFDALAESKS